MNLMINYEKILPPNESVANLYEEIIVTSKKKTDSSSLPIFS